MVKDHGDSLRNLGNLTVKYCQSFTSMAASAKSPTDWQSMEAELIEETTKIAKELERFLIKYVFSLTDVDFESLDYERKIKVEFAASRAILSASYTEPDVTHLMKPPMNFH